MTEDPEDVRKTAGGARAPGASGCEAIGAWSPAPSSSSGLEPPASLRDVYTYQFIDFSRTASPRLVGVTRVSYAGRGRTVVTYTPFGQ